MNNYRMKAREMRDAINNAVDHGMVINAMLTYFYDVFHVNPESRFIATGDEHELICTSFKALDQEIHIKIRKDELVFENKNHRLCMPGRICVINFDDNGVFCKVDAGTPVEFAAGYTDVCNEALMRFFKTLIDECGILIEKPFLIIENKCEEE